jgi:hypothetical protein
LLECAGSGAFDSLADNHDPTPVALWTLVAFDRVIQPVERGQWLVRDWFDHDWTRLACAGLPFRILRGIFRDRFAHLPDLPQFHLGKYQALTLEAGEVDDVFVFNCGEVMHALHFVQRRRDDRETIVGRSVRTDGPGQTSSEGNTTAGSDSTSWE